MASKITANIDVEGNRIFSDLHKARAKKQELKNFTFYRILRESAATKNILIITFDMQQNQALPKTNVGEGGLLQ